MPNIDRREGRVSILDEIGIPRSYSPFNSGRRRAENLRGDGQVQTGDAQVEIPTQHPTVADTTTSTPDSDEQTRS